MYRKVMPVILVLTISILVGCEFERNELYDKAKNSLYSDNTDIIENPDGPIPGDNGTINLAITGQASLRLTWTEALDGDGITPQNEIRYRIYQSNSPNIGSTDEMNSYGTMIAEVTGVSSFDISNFQNLSRGWYYNITAVDNDNYMNPYRITSTDNYFANKSLNIISKIPDEGQTGRTITITFDENIDTNSVFTAADTSCTGTVQIEFSGTESCYPITPVIVNNYYTFSFAITGQPDGTPITVTLTTGVRSLSGNTLPGNVTWSFITGP